MTPDRIAILGTQGYGSPSTVRRFISLLPRSPTLQLLLANDFGPCRVARVAAQTRHVTWTNVRWNGKAARFLRLHDPSLIVIFWAGDSDNLGELVAAALAQSTRCLIYDPDGKVLDPARLVRATLPDDEGGFNGDEHPSASHRARATDRDAPAPRVASALKGSRQLRGSSARARCTS